MENSLTSKITIKEHLRNMKNILVFITGMDKNYFYKTSIVHIINVIIPYITLMLSAYVLDSIGTGKEFKKILMLTALALLGILLLKFIASTIWHHAMVSRLNMSNLYWCSTQTKMLDMDFSRIDSQEVKDLKDRIQRDLNWGSGLAGVIGCFDSILYGAFNIIGAAIVGFPTVKYLIYTKEISAVAVAVLLIVFIAVFMKIRVKYIKMENSFIYDKVKEEEREERIGFGWGFAEGDGFSYNNIKDIKIYGAYDLLKRWTIEPEYSKAAVEDLRKGAIGNGGSGAILRMVHGAIEGSAYLIVVLIAIAGNVTAGNVVMLAGCLQRLISGLYGISESISDFAMEARKQCSTLELIRLEDEMYKGKIPVEKRSDNEYQIEFKNVSFKYPGTEEYVLKNFSMKLKIGEKLAIVGMNGSGKTTMIKLLCRLYDVNEGEILLNGVNIQKFDQDEYRKLFSIVFQDFNIFPYTLGQNVAADVEYDKEKIIDCLQKAGFGDRLQALDDGLDTFVSKEYDDGGVEFSGGELQKVAIARAIYKEAPFILLDEPTAALDPLAEYEIYSNFDKIIGTKTAIYISHRLSSCRFCKKIAVFHQGRLVQLGSHDELVKDKDGKYYEMWSAQAQYYA